MRFMAEAYFPSEPSIVNVGGELASRSSPDPLLVHLVDEGISQNLSLIAEDRLNDDCIIGAAINLDSRPFDTENNARLAAATGCCGCSQEARDLVEFYVFVSRQIDLWRAYCVDNVFECGYVAVHPEHQGQGIAKKLIEESWVLARDMAYRLFAINCTSRLVLLAAG